MSHFDIANLETELKKLEAETLKENFWQDTKNSNKVLARIKNIKNNILFYKLEQVIVHLLLIFMKSVGLFAHILLKTFLLITTTSRYMKMEYN